MSTATTATIPSQHASVFPPPADFRLPTSDFRLPTSDFQARPLLRIRCSTFHVCVDSLAPARLARMRAAVPTVSRAATLAAWVTGYTFDLPSSRRRYRAGVAPRLHVRLAHYAKALSRGCSRFPLPTFRFSRFTLHVSAFDAPLNLCYVFKACHLHIP